MGLQRSTRDRLVRLLLDQASPDSRVDYEGLAEALGYCREKETAYMGLQRSTRDCLVRVLLDQASPDSQVDYERLAEALGYSSVQMLAFLKSINAEFGTHISLVDIENTRGKGGLASLLRYSDVS